MKSVIFLVACMLSLGNCHVRLAFPAARKYALDFLDNVRTSAPCGGMVFDEANGHITTLETGKEIPVSWHLAYPHMGGIRLQLLNATSGEVTTTLTGDNYLYTNDSTVQSHTVTLEESMKCDHCILRLIRQAGEWTAGADGYLFWSCADVKIASPAAADTCYDGQCLNGGSCSSGTCSCPDTYVGDRCEFKNDCEADSDCNSNGACIDIDATTYPKKVCFCNSGFMGRYCSKASPVSTAKKTDTELNGYYHIEIMANPQYDLYWTIMGDKKDEIEFAIRVKTNNWAALGWRPDGIAASCKNFPTNTGGSSSQPEPEGTPEPEATPEPTATPEPATPEPTTTAARRRRAVEEEERVVMRQKRAAEVNKIKELCLAGNTSGAIAWATQDFNSDPSGEPEPEPEGTPEPETQPEGEPTAEPEGTGGNLHDMDCQDVIVIQAEGNRHRIIDSYTRDRSTPRADSFYGGTDDLTAAVAQREDGILHAVFRRKLVTSDDADQNLMDANSRFIWARGQDPKRFYHWPLTGLERCQASDYDFYRINELKYHGTKSTQRGGLIVNVYNDPDSSESAEEGSESAGCTGSNCKYTVSWKYRKSQQKVIFTVTAEVNVGQWAAVGFSNDRLMPNSDGVVGWMDSGNAQPTVTDRYITSRNPQSITLDSKQDLSDITGSYQDGKMTYTFSRAINTLDNVGDERLDKCVYFLMAWGGNVNGQDLTIHSDRDISSKKICIDSSSQRLAVSWFVLICAFIASRMASN